MDSKIRYIKVTGAAIALATSSIIPVVAQATTSPTTPAPATVVEARDDDSDWGWIGLVGLLGLGGLAGLSRKRNDTKVYDASRSTTR